MSSTTFPVITPRETICTPMAMNRPITSNAIYGSTHMFQPKNYTYGIYPPFIDTKIPSKVNPLVPPPPTRRMNHMYETPVPHFENEKRKLLMQQREHYRYHNTWSKAYYGSPAEKEAYRRQTRLTLKQQMADKWETDKSDSKEKTRESEVTMAVDNKCLQEDARDFLRKFGYLKQFRDENKRLMESSWRRTRQNTFHEQQYDREQLKYNPINWSCTLK